MTAKKPGTKSDKIEREYVILLREKVRVVPRYKKTNKAVKTVKEFLARHMKVYDKDLKKIKLDKYLNEALWFRGIRKPPAKIKVKAVKEGEIVRAELAEFPAGLQFKKAREEKKIQKAKEILEGKKKAMEKAKESMQQKPEDKEESEKKEEEKEKKAAVVEAGKEMAKEQAKKAKHATKTKAKEPKRQQRVALAK